MTDICAQRKEGFRPFAVSMVLFAAIACMAAVQAFAIGNLPNPRYSRVSHVNRSGTPTKDLKPESVADDPSVVGSLGHDDEGNVVVRWGVGLFISDSIAPKDYGNARDFTKAYSEKCESHADKSNDAARLGASGARKIEFNKIGKKIWAAHLEAAQAVRAKAEMDKAAEEMSRRNLLAGLPLESLFGIGLGKPIDLSQYAKTGKGKAYLFTPAKKFRGFEVYSFSVTPSSGVVYQIQAVSKACEAEDLEGEWVFVKRALMKKFRKQAVREAPNKAEYALLFPGTGEAGREIVVFRKASSIYITAVDLDQKKKAEEEQSAIDVSRLVPSSDDLDAL